MYLWISNFSNPFKNQAVIIQSRFNQLIVCKKGGMMYQSSSLFPTIQQYFQAPLYRYEYFSIMKIADLYNIAIFTIQQISLTFAFYLCLNYERRYLVSCCYSLFRNSMAWFQKKIWFRYLSSEIGTNVLVQLQNNFIDLYYLKIWAQNFRQNLKKGHNLLWNTLWMGN